MSLTLIKGADRMWCISRLREEGGGGEELETRVMQVHTISEKSVEYCYGTPVLLRMCQWGC